MVSYRALLSVPHLRPVLLSMQIARVAQSMVSVALVLFTLERFGSSTFAGFVTFASIFPGLLTSPIAGVLLDRHGRIRLVRLDYFVALAAMMVIGVLASGLIIGLTTLYMHEVFGIGSAAVPAPQATLMSTIITGLLNQNLPWGLVLVGIFIAVTVELCGVHSLSFAVGLYLPIATTAPIFAGGLVRAWVDRKTRVEESELGAGTLFSSGLIAGGSIAGILFAILVGTGSIDPAALNTWVMPTLYPSSPSAMANLSIRYECRGNAVTVTGRRYSRLGRTLRVVKNFSL